MQSNITSQYLKLHSIVLIWGGTAILGFLVKTDAISLTFYRSLFAIPVLLIVMYLSKIKFDLRTLKEYKLPIISGALLGIHWMLFYGSARVSNVSTSLIGLSTQALITSLLAPFFLRKRWVFHETLFSIFVIVGMVIIFYTTREGFILGLILSITCAFFSSMYSLTTSKIANNYHPQELLLVHLVSATLVCALVVLYLYSVSYDDLRFSFTGVSDLIYLIILSSLFTVYPFISVIKLFKTLSAFSINLAVNMEPIYGIILALIIFGSYELMSIGFYLGGSIIIITTMLHSYFEIQRKKNKISSI